MKTTLLEMVQDILSNLSSDEVNSISDTTESMQIATIIRQKYYDIINRGDLTKHDQLFQLTASADPTQPVLMFAPDGIGRIDYIKYFNSNPNSSAGTFQSFDNAANDIVTSAEVGNNSPPGYQYVNIVSIKQFLDQIDQFNPDEFNIESFTFSDTSNNYPGNYTFYYKTDRQPSYCCVLSNYYVIFDSYDSTEDSTLQSSKTRCYGQVIPTFSMVDNFTPNLDDKQFPLLLNESKSLAFIELKQMTHAKAEQEVKRQWNTLQKDKSMANKPSYFDQLPDFGRRSPYVSGPRFTW